MATLLGMLTGIGGGRARDGLLAEIHTVLRADLYAVAALAGAAIVVIANILQLPSGVDAFLGRRSAPALVSLRSGMDGSSRSPTPTGIVTGIRTRRANRSRQEDVCGQGVWRQR